MTENHILWEELGKLQQEWEKTTDGNTEINQMLEFSENDFVLFYKFFISKCFIFYCYEKDFKAAIIKIFQQEIMNSL